MDTCEEGKVVRKKQRAQVIVSTPRAVSTTRRNLASPMGKKDAGSAMETRSVEGEDEFVTPQGNFGSSGKKAAQLVEGDGIRAKIRSCNVSRYCNYFSELVLFVLGLVELI